MRTKVAVIGAGLGGLSSALLLARKGYEVTIFEKNNQLGGKINSLRADGFRFDTGASLVTMPFVIEKLFHMLGERLIDILEIKKLDIITKYFYPDGTVINAYSDLENFLDEIEHKTKDNASAVKKYLEYTKKIYELTADLFIFSDFKNLKNLLNPSGIKTLFNISKIDPFRSIHQANLSFFVDPKVVQLFDRFATYNGSSPYLAPATLNIIAYVEFFLGGYYFTGGMYSLIEALVNLCKKFNVDIQTNAEITKLIVQNGLVESLLINSQKKKFDLFVSNSDVSYTFANLLEDTKSTEAKRNLSNSPSSSALVFYWGVQGNHPNLETHNILFSENYKEEFNYIFNLKQIFEDPTVYIYISSKFNPKDAPPNHENWFVMINTPENTNQNWGEIVNIYRPVIINKIRKLTGIDLDGKITFEAVLTPKDLELRTLSRFGSIYGISSNNRNAAFLRQKNHSKTYKNLFFTGGSVHPGGGIPLVISSAMIVDKLLGDRI